MSGFDVDDLVNKSQQNGTKRGLGGATSGKNRIQIDYVEKDESAATAAATAAAAAQMKPMPFIKFVPATTAKPAAAKVEEEEEEKPKKKKKDDEPAAPKKKQKLDSDSDDEKKPSSSPLLKVVEVPAKEDLFASLKPHLAQYRVVNIWGQAKRATLVQHEEEEIRLKHPAFLLNLVGDLSSTSAHASRLEVELSSKHDGSRIRGLAKKLVAGSMGLHILFADGTAVDIPSHTEAITFLEKRGENLGPVVSAWGEVETARLVSVAAGSSSSDEEEEDEEVEVKSAQFISFCCKENVASLVDKHGAMLKGTLKSCKADKQGLKVLLERK